MKFRPPLKDQGLVYLEDTDKELPKKIDVRTRYAFFKTIARGGKSIIQSCKDLHLSRTICYKSIRKELMDNTVEQRRFLREARVTAMLQHPSTVPVYELGRDLHARCYFTMKLVQGYTLRELLDPHYRDRYDLTQLIDVIVRVAHGLDYAHTHGVVHRDIKPGNILVGPFGEVLILDWGLAKVWTRAGTSPEPPPEKTGAIESEELTITRQGELEGTVSYMSPEQIRRDADIDHRTDVFSLGTILFEILTGQRPTKGERVPEVLEEVLHGEPPKPSEVTSRHVPKQLEEICLRCIQRAPGSRIQSAAELVRELQQKWRA